MVLQSKHDNVTKMDDKTPILMMSSHVLLPVRWTGSSGVSMVSITDIASTGAAGVTSSFKLKL